MSNPDFEERTRDAWAGLTVFYACNVAALLLIAGGLWAYNHGFVDRDAIRPEESAFTLGEDSGFATLPMEAWRVHVSNPVRDFELTCEVAAWTSDGARMSLAWCPRARVEDRYGALALFDELAELADIDILEPERRSFVTVSAFGTRSGGVATRSFTIPGDGLDCLDFILADEEIALRPVVAAFGQVCLRGLDMRTALRRVLGSARIAGWDGTLSSEP